MAFADRVTFRTLYLYLVCLVTLVISVFAAVEAVRSTVALLYPDPGAGAFYGPGPEGFPEADREELERQEELARQSERRGQVLQLVGSGTTLLLAGPLYVYHWRRAQADWAARLPGDGTPSDGTPGDGTPSGGTPSGGTPAGPGTP